MKLEKVQNCQSNPERGRKKHSRSHNPLRLQLQKSEQCGIKTKNKNMHEWNRQPRNNPLHLWSINLLQGGKNIQWEKVSTASGVGKVGQPHVNQ